MGHFESIGKLDEIGSDARGAFFAKFCVSVALFVFLIGLTGCDRHEARRYRITATVDVNGTLISGSSVQSYKCHDGINNMDVSRCMLKGEAVVVNLKERGYLFLIFRNETWTVASILRAGGQNPYGPVQPFSSRPWTLPPESMPMMVTFKDANDPKTVVEVDRNNLANSFGTGVRLKGVLVEPTHDPVTWGQVEKALPWIRELDTLFDGKSGVTTRQLSSRLSRRAFMIGEKQ